MAFFRFGEIAEQPAHADILGLPGSLDVKLLGLEFHGLDFLADGVERQVLGQPDRTAFQETLDVFAADRRQMRPKALFIEFEQHVAMAAFFLGHLLEDLGRVRVAFGEVFGEGHVDAAVFLLGRDRNGQHFALGQIGEILHGTTPFLGLELL
jgi:hypothetical protein